MNKKKPLGVACITPALVAKLFGEGKLTVGSLEDPVSEALNTLGAEACECAADGVIVDADRRRVSTPAYMLEAPLSSIQQGLEKMVDQVITWAYQDQKDSLLNQVSQWSMRGHQLYREWNFDNFEQALAFTQKVGALAEAANHHPDLELGWGYVKVSLFTHDANALTDQDVSLARQIDAL